MHTFLHNTEDKKKLKQKAEEKLKKRYTLSFYKYLNLKDPKAFRDELYEAWDKLGVLGHIYVANRGINAS